MRVLQVVPALSPLFGGPSVAIVDLARALSAHDVEAKILSTNGAPRGRMIVEIGRPITYLGAQAEFFSVWPSGRYAFSVPLARALRRQVCDYDVLHIHWLYNFSSIAAAMAAVRAGVPYVLQFNGSIDPHLMRRNAWIKKLYMAAAGRFIVNHAAALIFTTEAERRSAAIEIADRPGHVVPVGLDWTQYAQLPAPGAFRAHHPEIGDRRIVLFFGRLSRQKRLDLLIPAFGTVAARHPDAHLAIAGPDGEGLEQSVRQWVRERALQDRVTFAGRVPDELKLAAYRDAAVYVLPSYAENFGATVTEASACGCPVVITNRVNLCDEIAAGDAGIVVDCSAEAVAAGLDRVLSDNGLALRLGRNGRDLVQRKFTWDAALETLIPIYEQVVAAARRRAA